MKYPALYVYRRTPDKGRELKYSIRSLRNLKSWNGQVFVAGDGEMWFKDIIHIPSRQRHTHPLRDVENKVLAALNYPELPDDFIFMNDDVYITAPTKLKSLHGGPLIGLKNSPHQRSKQRTAEYLQDNGIAEPLDYELHTPMLMDRTKRLVVSNIIRRDSNSTPLKARSLYGNLFAVGGEYYEDKKTKTAELKTGLYISTQFYVKKLDQLFPEPSEFEEAE